MLLKLALFIVEFIISFFTCAVVSVEVLKESVNYLILSVLILIVRVLSGYVGRKIDDFNKKNKVL
jgi:hypothetical protein